ncbi:MAG: cytosol nonspecific dipeptidase [Bacteroidetes bacterium HGW-Bacteroidetes-6]|jgi:dipeptidase D|nr:MAG: cytosol nonspecific dipeptidase [Bacteroidetes bacterium HGW-Bacteroidetes-6]
MENVFQGLEPARVWHYFAEICTIPHPSKKEEKMVKYLIEFGQKHNLETISDEVGNVVIRKSATAGFENKPWVALQSHIDMVCEKTADSNHNFDTDPIRPRIEGEWVKATNTTLGADDGIGVATQLALLEASDIAHGPIECLFTVDEETGLTGAFALKPDMLKSRILINLDSEDEGEIFIGCAGGRDTTGTRKFSFEPAPTGTKALEIKVSGLKGGHSGDDIQKGLGNANKILGRALWTISNETTLKLSKIDGGNLRNAIARDAVATIIIPAEKEADIISYIEKYNNTVALELKVTDAGVKVEVKQVAVPTQVIDSKTTTDLLNLIYAMPHGVIAWSQDIEGFVETSTNLASVKMSNDTITVATSQRSSVESAKENINNMAASVFRLAGFEYTQGDGYPGWTPNPKSAILDITVHQFEKQFGTKPVVRAIHAGLECGLFSEKIPGMDMVSFGPTLRGVHSPDEKLLIPTVGRFYQLVINVLQNV